MSSDNPQILNQNKLNYAAFYWPGASFAEFLKNDLDLSLGEKVTPIHEHTRISWFKDQLKDYEHASDWGAIHWAIHGGKAENVELLLQQGVDPRWGGPFNQTQNLLDFAMCRERISMPIAQSLVAKGNYSSSEIGKAMSLLKCNQNYEISETNTRKKEEIMTWLGVEKERAELKESLGAMSQKGSEMVMAEGKNINGSDKKLRL